MRLSSQDCNFYFSFPKWFYKPVEKMYKILLEKNHVQHESVADYINHTIKDINLPDLKFDTVEQKITYGKGIIFSGSKSDYDIYSRSLIINFRDVDSKINYFIMERLVREHYYNTSKKGFDKFGNISLLISDFYGDVIFKIVFRQCLITSLSGTKFVYNSQGISSQNTFSMGIAYNFHDIYLSLGDEEPEGELLLREQIYEDGSTLPVYNDTETENPIKVMKTNRL